MADKSCGDTKALNIDSPIRFPLRNACIAIKIQSHRWGLQNQCETYTNRCNRAILPDPSGSPRVGDSSTCFREPIIRKGCIPLTKLRPCLLLDRLIDFTYIQYFSLKVATMCQHEIPRHPRINLFLIYGTGYFGTMRRNPPRPITADRLTRSGPSFFLTSTEHGIPHTTV